jgi:hypothetical protein
MVVGVDPVSIVTDPPASGSFIETENTTVVSLPNITVEGVMVRESVVAASAGSGEMAARPSDNVPTRVAASAARTLFFTVLLYSRRVPSAVS